MSSGFCSSLLTSIRGMHPALNTALDADGDALARGITGGPSLVKPNVRELERLLKRSLPGMRAIKEAAGSLAARGVRYVLVTLGDAGAVCFSENKAVRVQGPRVVSQGAVGCGDAFLGGFVHALAVTGSFTESVRYAAASGTAKAMMRGTAMPSPDDVKRVLRHIRIS